MRQIDLSTSPKIAAAVALSTRGSELERLRADRARYDELIADNERAQVACMPALCDRLTLDLRSKDLLGDDALTEGECIASVDETPIIYVAESEKELEEYRKQ